MKDHLETEAVDKNIESDLLYSCERIEAEPVDGIVENGFTVESKSGKMIKGYLVCTDPRMKVEPTKFQGEKIDFSLTFDANGLPQGGEARGSLSFISNRGEKQIPYLIRHSRIKLESSLGEIRNLFHFANLARTSWNEAVKLFFQPDFSEILSTAQEEERELYRGLVGTQKEQAVEEFLQGIRKKKPVTYKVESTILHFENIEEDRKEELKIEKDGWGYTKVYLKTEGDFLSLEKDCLGDSDFLGNCCMFPLYLHANRLHQGKNYGQIFFEYAYGCLILQVEVWQNQHHRMRIAIEKRRSLKRMKAQLTNLYVDFRAKRIAAPRWRKETESLLEKMRGTDERNPHSKLFMAHLYITSDKQLEARWLLDRVGKNLQEEKDPITYAYYLYLTTLLKEDGEYQEFVGQKITELYYGEKGSWQIAWLMLYLSHELSSNTQKKWEFLLEVFQSGCTSPVLYTEAVMLLNYQPTLLMELEPVQLRILHFGQKRNMLSAEVKGVLQYLALREKEYSDSLRRLLEDICTREENLPMLQSLCSLLIKGNKREKRYFPWYEKAVYGGLKITRLYEYYMMSLDQPKKIDIPRMVLMYFSYESSLSYPNAAYLYRYVYENREDLEELYLVYAPKIERFLLKQLYEERINEDLGYLYEHILVPAMLTPDNAAALERVMFLHSFVTTDRRDERLIVVPKHQKEESAYDFHQKEARVFLPGKNYLLFREDGRGQRFLVPQEEYPKAFLSLSALAPQIGGQVDGALGVALYICEDRGGWQPIQPENERQFIFLSESPALLETEQQRLRSHLLDYYYEKDKMGMLDNWLEECSPDALGEGEQKKLIHYLVSRGFYEKAYEFILGFGPERMEPKALVRISTYMLEEEKQNPENLLWLIDTAFQKGKYNLPMLNFLTRHYRGTCEQMLPLFRAARDFDVESYELSENLLMQMLFSQTELAEDLEVFKAYVAGGAKTPLEAAFLTWRAKAFLWERRELEEYLVRDIARVYRRGFKLYPITHLAYLKYYARHQKEEADKELVQIFLREAVEKTEWHLPFLLEYKNYPELESLLDKSILFYQGKPGERIVLHYCKNGSEEEEVYTRENMEELYGGVYSAEFILFSGEELRYYIICEQDNQEQMMGSGVLTKKWEEGERAESRYGLINRMAEYLQLEEFDQTEQLLEEYWKKEYLTEEIFRL